MARILGGIGSALARLFDIDGGRVFVDELRDTEGVGLTYDLASLVESTTLRIDTRSFDTGAINQSIDDSQLIEGLPAMARIIGMDISTDDATRLTRVHVFGEDIGGADQPNSRGHLWWTWLLGGDTVPRPTGFQAGDFTLQTMLQAAEINDELTATYPVYIDQSSATQRRGYRAIRINTLTTAFGAGTVRVTGHVVLLFPTGFGSTRFNELLPRL